jgi:hypothetical protein
MSGELQQLGVNLLRVGCQGSFIIGQDIPQKQSQITSTKELQDHVLMIVGGAMFTDHTQQLHYVGMIKLSHDVALFEELDVVPSTNVVPQCLDGHTQLPTS